MKNENYSCGFTIAASPQKIFESICNVQGWWATDVKGNSQKLNDVFTVRFGKTYGTFKIIESVPWKKILWLVTDSYLPLFKNKTQWLNTKIMWQLNEHNGSSELIMTHIGLTPEIECYTDCKKGWNFYVGESLSSLITKDKGYPGTGIFAHISADGKRYEGLLFLKADPLPELVGEYNLIDVRETTGEHVTAIYSIKKLNTQTFNVSNLQGEYYMLIENKPLYNNIRPLKDIQQIFSIH